MTGSDTLHAWFCQSDQFFYTSLALLWTVSSWFCCCCLCFYSTDHSNRKMYTVAVFICGSCSQGNHPPSTAYSSAVHPFTALITITEITQFHCSNDIFFTFTSTLPNRVQMGYSGTYAGTQNRAADYKIKSSAHSDIQGIFVGFFNFILRLCLT